MSLILHIYIVWRICIATDKLANRSKRKSSEEFGLLEKRINDRKFFMVNVQRLARSFYRGITEIIEKTWIFQSAMRRRKDITQYQGKSWIACSRISAWQYAAAAPVVTYLPIYLPYHLPFLVSFTLCLSTLPRGYEMLGLNKGTENIKSRQATFDFLYDRTNNNVP